MWVTHRIWNPLFKYIGAAAKSLQSCPTLCDPIEAAHQAPPSPGLSRQEHWSGLPFPSPTHESEKWKWSYSVVSDSWRPHGPQPTRLLCPWDFPGKSTGVGCHCLLHLPPQFYANFSLANSHPESQWERDSRKGSSQLNHVNDRTGQISSLAVLINITKPRWWVGLLSLEYTQETGPL